MGFRELSMVQLKEILRLWLLGQSYPASNDSLRSTPKPSPAKCARLSARGCAAKGAKISSPTNDRRKPPGFRFAIQSPWSTSGPHSIAK
jgi:hypothetical protein